MKKIIGIVSATMVATSAAAGTLVYTPPEVTMIDNAETMGGSGSWLVPLVILGLLVLALTQNSDTGNGNGNGGGNGVANGAANGQLQ